MDPQEVSKLKDEIQKSERGRNRKFTLYTGLMILLGLSIGIWSMMEGDRARKFQLQSESSLKKMDSLQARVNKANELLAVQKEKLINNQRINGHIRIGLENFYSKRYDLAIHEYDEAIALDAENYVLFDLRGYSYFKLKQFDEAIQSLRKSIEIEPNYGWGYYNLCLAYWASGDREGAKLMLQKLLEIAPEFRKTLKNDFQFRDILNDPDMKRIVS